VVITVSLFLGFPSGCLDVSMQKVFLDSGERGGNHKKKVGSNVEAALSTLDATDGRHNSVKAATDKSLNEASLE
nr:hypothetical protein [Tanacetum cinerariifolium]